MDSMEALCRLVGGVYYHVQPRMPGGIDTGREDGVIFHIHLLHLAIIGNDSTSIILTGMKLHTRRIVLLVMVTIDALAVFLETAELIIVDNALVIVFQAALVDGQCLVADKRREDETVAQITIDAIG